MNAYIVPKTLFHGFQNRVMITLVYSTILQPYLKIVLRFPKRVTIWLPEIRTYSDLKIMSQCQNLVTITNFQHTHVF